MVNISIGCVASTSQLNRKPGLVSDRNLNETSKYFNFRKLQQTIRLQQSVPDRFQQDVCDSRRYRIPNLLLDAGCPKLVTQWEALQASELAVRIVPLPTRMDDATTTGGNASSNFVPRLR